MKVFLRLKNDIQKGDFKIHGNGLALNDQVYECDKIISNEVSNYELFNLIREASLSNRNLLLLCYGRTCSGKTYTMTGTDKNGLVYLLLDYFQSNAIEFSLSAIEIYNEQMYNLVNKKFKIRNLGEAAPMNSAKVNYQTLTNIFSNRSTYATVYNKQSSRSHLILSFKVNGYSINIVDLAGNEAIKNMNDPQRIKESLFINKSLLTIKHCLQSLLEKQSKAMYLRDSKLTFMFKDYFNGNNDILVLLTIDPLNTSDTVSTLKFGSIVKNVTIAPETKNEIQNIKEMYENLLNYTKELEKSKDEMIANYEQKLNEMENIYLNTINANDAINDSKLTNKLKLLEEVKSENGQKLKTENEELKLKVCYLETRLESYERSLLTPIHQNKRLPMNVSIRSTRSIKPSIHEIYSPEHSPIPVHSVNNSTADVSIIDFLNGNEIHNISDAPDAIPEHMPVANSQPLNVEEVMIIEKDKGEMDSEKYEMAADIALEEGVDKFDALYINDNSPSNRQILISREPTVDIIEKNAQEEDEFDETESQQYKELNGLLDNEESYAIAEDNKHESVLGPSSKLHCNDSNEQRELEIHAVQVEGVDPLTIYINDLEKVIHNQDYQPHAMEDNWISTRNTNTFVNVETDSNIIPGVSASDNTSRTEVSKAKKKKRLRIKKKCDIIDCDGNKSSQNENAIEAETEPTKEKEKATLALFATAPPTCELLENVANAMEKQLEKNRKAIGKESSAKPKRKKQLLSTPKAPLHITDVNVCATPHVMPNSDLLSLLQQSSSILSQSVRKPKRKPVRRNKKDSTPPRNDINNMKQATTTTKKKLKKLALAVDENEVDDELIKSYANAIKELHLN